MLGGERSRFMKAYVAQEAEKEYMTANCHHVNETKRKKKFGRSNEG